MISKHDEGKGVVKVFWKDIRDRVAKVAPEFAKLVDKLSPGKNMPLYLAYLQYGESLGDVKGPFLPKPDSGVYTLDDTNTPADIVRDLGYGKNSLPMGMVLDKNLESYIDLPQEDNKSLSIPWMIYRPGMMFPMQKIFRRQGSRKYSANTILSATVGARSTFMLPYIGRAVNHAFVQRDYNIHLQAPQSLYDEWAIFKAIAQSEASSCDWRASILYFSEKWVLNILNDPAWFPLKVHLYDIAWQGYEYPRNRMFYDIAFSIVQKRRHLKPNPYLVDTARHLFAVALGAAPGYAPATNEDFLPLGLLQKVYTDAYKLEKYTPTVMQPVNFRFESDRNPVYYSLQNPSAHAFSPKSRNPRNTAPNILVELRELRHIISVFQQELLKQGALCADTVLAEVARSVKFEIFHNKKDSFQEIQMSNEIPQADDRFDFISPGCKPKSKQFSADATFVRGCVRITALNNSKTP